MFKTVGDIMKKLGYEGIWVRGARHNENLIRLDEGMSLLELRPLIDYLCTTISFSENGSGFCPYCSRKGCPDSPDYNDFCNRDYWQPLNPDERMFVRAVFQDGYEPAE